MVAKERQRSLQFTRRLRIDRSCNIVAINLNISSVLNFLQRTRRYWTGVSKYYLYTSVCPNGIHAHGYSGAIQIVSRLG